MYRDHEFDPVTPEEQARREQEEEFARRVRREVRRMERGEAEERERRERRRRSAPSGSCSRVRSSCARASRNTIPIC